MKDEEHLTSVYRSGDDGRTWTNLTHIAGAFWSSLFKHRGAIYLIGTSAQYGSIVIRRSDDGGNTWTHPRDEHTGLIARGGPYHDPPNYHCAPMPVLLRGGRLYRAFEDLDPVRLAHGVPIAGHFRAGGCRSARCRKLDAQQSACLRSGLDAAGMGR